MQIVTLNCSEVSDPFSCLTILPLQVPKALPKERLLKAFAIGSVITNAWLRKKDNGKHDVEQGRANHYCNILLRRQRLKIVVYM